MNRIILLLSVISLILTSCSEKAPEPAPAKPRPPGVLLNTPTYIGPYEATLNGVYSVGDKDVKDLGFIYSQASIASVSEGTKIPLSLIGTNMSVVVEGLTEDKTYFTRGYAITEDTTVLSSELTFKTAKTNTWIFQSTFKGGGIGGAHAPGHVINGKGYLFSGLIPGNTPPPLYTFDKEARSVQVSTDSPMPYLSQFKTLAIGDTIYICLGQLFGGGSNLGIWKYNVSSKAWKQGGDFPMPMSASNLFTFTMDGKGYVLGKSSGFNVLHVYYPPFGVWIQSNKLPDNTTQFKNVKAVFTTETAAYAIVEYTTGVNFLWKMDSSTSEWTQMAQVPVTNLDTTFGQGYTLTDNLVYFLQSNKSLQEYNIANNTWIEKTKFADTSSDPIGGFIFGDRFYMLSTVNIWMLVFK